MAIIDARDLSFGDIVSYHKTILFFEGIRMRKNYGRCAIYNGDYAVEACLQDSSIKAVYLTEQSLAANGFTTGTDENGFYAWHSDAPQIFLRKSKDFDRAFDVDIRENWRHYERLEGEGYIYFWHSLQALLRLMGKGELARSFITFDGYEFQEVVEND